MNHENKSGVGPELPPPLPTRTISKTRGFNADSNHLINLPTPMEASGWCWGGFLLSWIWAIRFRVWWGLLALVPLVGFGVMIALGLKGRELAWRNHRWDSVEAFNQTQRRWTVWGASIAAVGALLAVAGYAVESTATDQSSTEQTRSVQWPIPEDHAVNPPTAVDEHTSNGDLERGIIDATSPDLPKRVETIGGLLEIQTIQNGSDAVFLNGQQLFSGLNAPYQQLIKKFTLPNGADAVLLASSGARGNSCETLYFFLLFDSNGLQYTPEFGSCSPYAAYVHEGDRITLTMDQMGGTSAYQLKNGRVWDGSQFKVMREDNDPSK